MFTNTMLSKFVLLAIADGIKMLILILTVCCPSLIL